MRLAGRLALSGLALVAGSVAALAQSAVISARSGLIHYVEGQVYLGDQLVESKFGNFPEVKENQQLKTEEGRAEVLLTPGVFLRLGENSAFRMITNRLIDTRLELVSGSAVVEAEDIGKDNSITVVYQDATVHILKKGLYRFDSNPAELRVYAGVAEVTADDHTVEAREGHLIALDRTLAMRKFDRTTTDALNRWSERRAEYVSMANVSAANSLRSSLFGGGSSFYGSDSPFAGGWYFNSFFGMYTFVPGMGLGSGSGGWYSPYGFRYWSPFDVYMAYMPGYYYSPYGYPGYGYGSGYGYGGGRGSNASGAYNAVNYKSVPTPSHSGSVLRGGSGSAGSVASSHGPSSGSGHSSSSGSVSSGSVAISAPVSHGGGGGNSSHR